SVRILPLLFGAISHTPESGLKSSSIDNCLLGLFSFDHLYVIKAALDRAFPATSHRLTTEFIHHLSTVPAGGVGEMLSQWSECALKSRFCDPLELFRGIERDWRESLRETSIVDAHAYQWQGNTEPIRFITLTPTRVILHTPKPMTKNRVTRHFGAQHFIR